MLSIQKHCFTTLLVPIFLTLSTGCGGGSDSTDSNDELSFTEKVKAVWESECKNGWMITIDLLDDQNSVWTEQEWTGDTCDGEPYYSNPLTFDYLVGETYITTDNKAAREFDITFDIDDVGDVTYTIIWFDENGFLYFGDESSADGGDPSSRHNSFTYNTPLHQKL